jgi:hypothetical protein
MKHSNLVNAIAAVLGTNARESSRKHLPAIEEKEHPTNITFFLKRTEVSVSDYDSGRMCFKTRMTELGNDTVVPTKEIAMKKVMDSNPHFQQFYGDNSNSTLLDISGALDYAGMSGNYFRILRDFVTVINNYAVMNRGPSLLGASNQFGNEYIAFFVQLEDAAVIIQIEK